MPTPSQTVELTVCRWNSQCRVPVSSVVVSYVIVSGTPPEAAANVNRTEKPSSRGSHSERVTGKVTDFIQAAIVSQQKCRAAKGLRHH